MTMGHGCERQVRSMWKSARPVEELWKAPFRWHLCREMRLGLFIMIITIFRRFLPKGEALRAGRDVCSVPSGGTQFGSSIGLHEEVLRGGTHADQVVEFVNHKLSNASARFLDGIFTASELCSLASKSLTWNGWWWYCSVAGFDTTVWCMQSLLSLWLISCLGLLLSYKSFGVPKLLERDSMPRLVCVGSLHLLRGCTK
ncbi:hypothetical protein ACOSP7_018392 [Xanthoceras sorbifolium]